LQFSIQKSSPYLFKALKLYTFVMSLRGVPVNGTEIIPIDLIKVMLA